MIFLSFLVRFLNGFHHHTRNDPVIITGKRYLGKNKTKICRRLGDLINSHPVDRKHDFFLVLPKEWG